MSRYLSIVPLQRPFSVAVDDNGREIFSCNFRAMAAAPVEDFEEEIVQILEDAGLGTFGVDIFIGPDSVLPVGDGPYITVIDTAGGGPPDITHDGKIYEALHVQTLIRAKTYDAARTAALAAWRAIRFKYNLTVVAA